MSCWQSNSGGSPLGPVAYPATGFESHLVKQVFSPVRKWLFVFSMIVSVMGGGVKRNLRTVIICVSFMAEVVKHSSRMCCHSHFSFGKH